MRSCLAGLSVALVSEPFWFGTLPAFAKPTEFQDNSFDTDLDGDASALMADGKRAQQTRLRMPCMTAVPRFLVAVSRNGRRQALPRISRSVKRAESPTRHDRRGTDHPHRPR